MLVESTEFRVGYWSLMILLVIYVLLKLTILGLQLYAWRHPEATDTHGE